MLRNLSLVAILGLSACAVPVYAPLPPTELPPEPEPEVSVNPGSAKERFVSAAEANGCVVNARTAPLILTDATLSQEDLARIMTELKTEGRGDVASDGQSFRLTTGTCA